MAGKSGSICFYLDTSTLRSERNHLYALLKLLFVLHEFQFDRGELIVFPSLLFPKYTESTSRNKQRALSLPSADFHHPRENVTAIREGALQLHAVLHETLWLPCNIVNRKKLEQMNQILPVIALSFNCSNTNLQRSPKDT